MTFYIYDQDENINAVGYEHQWPLSIDVHPRHWKRTINKIWRLLKELLPNGGELTWEQIPQYIKDKTCLWRVTSCRIEIK